MAYAAALLLREVLVEPGQCGIGDGEYRVHPVHFIQTRKAATYATSQLIAEGLEFLGLTAASQVTAATVREW